MSAWLNHNLTAFDIGKMITLSLHLIDHSRSHLIKPKRPIRRLNGWTLLMQMWYARYEYQSNPKRGKKAACFGVIWFTNSSQENISHTLSNMKCNLFIYMIFQWTWITDLLGPTIQVQHIITYHLYSNCATTTVTDFGGSNGIIEATDLWVSNGKQNVSVLSQNILIICQITIHFGNEIFVLCSTFLSWF